MTATPSRWSARELDRRTVLRGLGIGSFGLAGALLIGCGESAAEKAAMEKDKIAKEDAMKAATTTAAAAKVTSSPVATAAAKAAPVNPSDLWSAKELKLVSWWYRGQEARYYDFGMNTALTSTGAVAVAPIWVFAAVTNTDGSPRMVEVQHNVIDVLPGQSGYSDLWEVRVVTVPADYKADTIKSRADVEAARYPSVAAGIFVNCPVVPAGSTFEGDEKLVQGWYREQQAFYQDFGPNPATAIPIWAFTNGSNADGSPKLVDGQKNVIDSIPGQPWYSAFWLVNMVTVGADYHANAVNAAAQNLKVGQTNLMVNCPVVSPKA
ncbi:MAG: hypothetical protein EXR66_05100 [Dehalococcoidia bacterium]|nr:hypothetical protein [Dehalococcoidia bacterium]